MEDPGEDFTRDLDAPALEALIETMILAAFADGRLSDEERVHFARSVELLTGGRLTAHDAGALLARVHEDLGKSHRSERIATIRERLPDLALRRVALTLATDMAAADGVMLPEELRVIEELGQALGIPPEETHALVSGFRRQQQDARRRGT